MKHVIEVGGAFESYLKGLRERYSDDQIKREGTRCRTRLCVVNMVSDNKIGEGCVRDRLAKLLIAGTTGEGKGSKKAYELEPPNHSSDPFNLSRAFR